MFADLKVAQSSSARGLLRALCSSRLVVIRRQERITRNLVVFYDRTGSNLVHNVMLHRRRREIRRRRLSYRFENIAAS